MTISIDVINDNNDTTNVNISNITVKSLFLKGLSYYEQIWNNLIQESDEQLFANLNSFFSVLNFDSSLEKTILNYGKIKCGLISIL